MTTKPSGSTGRRIAAGIAVGFGALTIVSGGVALFGGPQMQTVAGNVVPFVLWFNFLSGFVYVVAGLGIALHKPWGGTLATVLAVAIVAVFALFIGHVFRGGAYEMRTMFALGFRAAVWIAIAIFLFRVQRGSSIRTGSGT